ncbi:MAG: transposase [Candidatus Dormibacteria bacterium]
MEAALVELEPTFEGMYAEIGGPSIPREHLLKRCLLMPLYTTRSECQFCERLRYDLPFRLLRDAEPDVLAYLAFPTERWRSIRSTNALDRVNAEIDRRAKVVGTFPNSAALLRLSTAVLQEQHDEWQDGRSHFSQQSMARLDPAHQEHLAKPLTARLAA